MIHIRSIMHTTVVLCAASIMFTGCGVGEKKLTEADMRIKALETKGVPDTLLSSAKVYLSQVVQAKKVSDGGSMKTGWDSLGAILKRADAWLVESQATMKPFVDARRKVYTDKRAQLTGLQAVTLDSMTAFVDSFITKNWLLQAKQYCMTIDSMLPVLEADEVKVTAHRKELMGTWKGEQEPAGSEENKKINAVQTSIYTFKNDGSLHINETMKGQSDINRKEDWAFESWGRYDLKGDTILMFLEREKCLRQIISIQDDAGKWKATEGPKFDTTLAKGAKDRTLEWKDLKENFKKSK